MSRREPRIDLRFYINMDDDNLEVHDLDDQRQGCQINEIVDGEHIEISNDKESLEEWMEDNPEYDGCEYCLEEYHRK